VVAANTTSDPGQNTQNPMHPLFKGKNGVNKVSVSSSNLEDSIGGIVGNKIQSRQMGSRKNVNTTANFAQKIVSPGVARKSQHPKP